MVIISETSLIGMANVWLEILPALCLPERSRFYRHHVTPSRNKRRGFLDMYCVDLSHR